MPQVKYCPFKISGDDRTCDQSNCEWWVETMANNTELDDCAMVLLVRMELPKYGASLNEAE